MVLKEVVEVLAFAEVVHTYEEDRADEVKEVAETFVDHAQCLPDRSLNRESHKKPTSCVD